MVRKRRRVEKKEECCAAGVGAADDDDDDDTQPRDTPARPDDAHAGLGAELASLLAAARRSGNSSSVRRLPAGGGEEVEEGEDIRALFQGMREEEAAMEVRRRECPVPRPRGMIRDLLGFGRDGRRQRVADVDDDDDDSGQRAR